MSNSRWHDYATDKPPADSAVLALVDRDVYGIPGSRFVMLHTLKISNGTIEVIDGLNKRDFDGEILCWRYLDDLNEGIPLKYQKQPENTG